jgi:hypothetical protein
MMDLKEGSKGSSEAEPWFPLKLNSFFTSLYQA